MEHGKLTRDEFMDDIAELMTHIGRACIKNGEIPDDGVTPPCRAPCPKCGGVVQENYRKFQCQKCDFSLWRMLSGREWSPAEIAELITKRRSGRCTGFRSRMGKPFAAGIKLNDELQARVRLRPAAARRRRRAARFLGQEPLGPCPKCGARVFEHGMAYVCEKARRPGAQLRLPLGPDDPAAPIEREQMKKLLATGRTDLLTASSRRRAGRSRPSW